MGGHTQSPSPQHAAPACDHLRGRPRLLEMVDGGVRVFKLTSTQETNQERGLREMPDHAKGGQVGSGR